MQPNINLPATSYRPEFFTKLDMNHNRNKYDNPESRFDQIDTNIESNLKRIENFQFELDRITMDYKNKLKL